MLFNFFIERAVNARRADNELSQNKPDTEISTQGRSIGDVRDQSAMCAINRRCARSIGTYWMIGLVCESTLSAVSAINRHLRMFG